MKKLILASLLAALSASAMATDYYVVVPLPNKQVAPSIQVSLTAYTLPGGLAGAPYAGFNFNSVLQVKGDTSFNASGVTWQVTGGALPAGLALSSAGLLTGTPVTAGQSSFQLQATYKTKTGQQSYQVDVTAPAPNFQVQGNIAASQNLGTVNIGSASSPLAINVTNSGTGKGTLVLPAFTGANPGDYTAATTCANVAAGANCQVSVSFGPTQSGARSAALLVAGTTFSFSGTGAQAATQYVVIKSGTSYQIPAGVNNFTVWAVGGGGGGGGATKTDATSGGGGGAGGTTWATFQAQANQTLTYAVGAGGQGGYNTSAGSPGGTTTVTYNGITLQAFGGNGGYYQNANPALGGGWSGGTGGVAGGNGYGASGDVGGGGGGAIGYSSAVVNPGSMYAGSHGATASYQSGLDAALKAAGEALGIAGVGSAAGSSTTANVNQGASGQGYGHGGGGAGYYGGNGGAGALGGGGGGAAGYTGYQTGGAGGPGFIVIKLN